MALPRLSKAGAQLAISSPMKATDCAMMGEVCALTSFSGKEVYDWCQHDRKAVNSYVAGLFDQAAHVAAVIDDTRHWSKDMPINDADVDFAL